MNKLICFFSLLCIATTSFACEDEACRKQVAETQRGEKFPSYLSSKYCGDIAMEFMTTTIKSLQSYRQKQLASKHRGGMNNTSRFIEQRKEWLEECDEYLSMTSKNRLFKDAKTTNRILKTMDSVSKELKALVKGVTYTNESGDDTVAVAGEKFDQLFSLVEQHKTKLLLKGQYVIR